MRGRARIVLAALAVVGLVAAAALGTTSTANGRASSPAASPTGRLHVRQRHQARHPDSVRQHALPAGQRERPIGPRADAAPAELHPRQRHPAHQRPHGPDLAYRDRDPLHADRRLPRPDGTADLEQLPLLHADWREPHRRRVRVLDGAAVRPGRTAVPAAGADRPHARDDQRERQDRPGTVGPVHAGGL